MPLMRKGSAKIKHYAQIMGVLKRRYTAPAASSKASPWECLVFTLLSARTRDEQTEVVLQELLRQWPTPRELAQAKVADVERVLQRIGLYKKKARNVVELARRIQNEYGGKVPQEFAALIDLPGVGVKTASCVLVYAYGKPAVPVDTHVHRIANRLGWVKEKTPERTAQALRVSLPPEYWMDVNRVMVQFGREVCIPGTPRCPRCPLRAWCAYP